MIRTESNMLFLPWVPAAGARLELLSALAVWLAPGGAYGWNEDLLYISLSLGRISRLDEVVLEYRLEPNNAL